MNSRRAVMFLHVVRGLSLIVLFAMLVAPAGVSYATEFRPGDPVAGRAFSEKRCAECHVVAVDAKPSPNRHAPRFTDVAKQASTTEMSLRVFLQSTHKRMPDLTLTARERNDVIAYILSLKPR